MDDGDECVGGPDSRTPAPSVWVTASPVRSVPNLIPVAPPPPLLLLLLLLLRPLHSLTHHFRGMDTLSPPFSLYPSHTESMLPRSFHVHAEHCECEKNRKSKHGNIITLDLIHVDDVWTDTGRLLSYACAYAPYKIVSSFLSEL